MHGQLDVKRGRILRVGSKQGNPADFAATRSTAVRVSTLGSTCGRAGHGDIVVATRARALFADHRVGGFECVFALGTIELNRHVVPPLEQFKKSCSRLTI